jgi:hypothetical protein
METSTTTERLPQPMGDRDRSFDGLIKARRRSASELERSLTFNEVDRLVLPLALSIARLCARIDAQAAYDGADIAGRRG